MREIKFRAWDKVYDNMTYNIQNMYEGICDVTDNGLYYYMGCFASFLEDESFIIMESTNILDMNGGEIYEGDILEFTSPSVNYDGFNTTIVEVFRDVRGSFRIKGSGIYTTELYCNRNKVGVIGNIYENANLLR